MIAMQGYYNGTVCIPEEGEKLQLNQKVIITALMKLLYLKHVSWERWRGKELFLFPIIGV